MLLAFGLAAIAAFIDMQRQDTLGKIYQGAYIVGCVAAICWVRRRSLFGPMVQPPLVFAVTAIAAVVILAPSSGSGGLKQLIFSVALPLTSNFPTMAITTGVTVAIGGFRLWRERDPDPEVRPSRKSRTGDVPGDDRPARGLRGRGDGDERPAVGTRGGEPSAGRRERPSKDRVPPARRGRGEPDSRGRAEPDAGRARPERAEPDPARPRPEPDAAPEARRGLRNRQPRDPRREGDRDPGAPRGDRGAREDRPRGDRGTGRGRSREGDPPPRRRDPGAEGRPRREDRPARRDPDRGTPPAREPRRRPPDPYR
ncbi:DUF6542 domain-containing protein [Actinophytocola sp.]|uniref:DUF6542 domain-containing protein n=1 Tax=Actinophytocola sp. TaxID=1872138 RepID=UPI002ED8B703